MNKFVERISEIGLFRSIVEFQHEVGVSKEVDAVISFGVDVVRAALDDDVSRVDKDDQFAVCQFFGLWLKKNPTVDPNALLDVGVGIHNSKNVDKVGDQMPYCIGGYFEQHADFADKVAERVLSNEDCVDFVPGILPVAIKANSEKWLPHVLDWISEHENTHFQACGLAALANLDKNAVESEGRGEIVYRVLDNLARTVNLDQVGIALYNASKTWSANNKFGKKFEVLRNRLINSGNGRVLNVVALSDRDGDAAMSEADISVRLSAFGDLLKSKEPYNRAVDGYLAHLIKVKPESVINLLGKVICEGDGRVLEDGALHQTFSAISLGAEELKNQVVTKWLLSSEVKLWRGAQKLVKELHRPDDLGIRVDVGLLPSDDIGRINLFRRAVGWLFWAHLTCVGYAISCLEHLSVSALDFIKPIFYDLLTMNFPDVVEKAAEIRAETVDSGDQVLAFLKEQVSLHKRLEKSLSMTGVMNELLPPVEDRIEYAKLESERQRKIQEEARKRSFLGLFNCVTVLYGNGMIGKQYAVDGEKRTVVPFEGGGVKFRIPAMMHCAEVTLQAELEDAMYLPVETK